MTRVRTLLLLLAMVCVEPAREVLPRSEAARLTCSSMAAKAPVGSGAWCDAALLGDAGARLKAIPLAAEAAMFCSSMAVWLRVFGLGCCFGSIFGFSKDQTMLTTGSGLVVKLFLIGSGSLFQFRQLTLVLVPVSNFPMKVQNLAYLILTWVSAQLASDMERKRRFVSTCLSLYYALTLTQEPCA